MRMWDLSVYDRIVTDFDFTDKLRLWANDYHDANPNASVNLFEISLFKEIVWNIAGSNLYVLIEGDEIKFALITPSGKLDAVWKCKWENEAMNLYASEDETVSYDLMKSFLILFTSLMIYIREYKEEPSAVVENTSRIKKTKKPKKGKSYNNRVTYLTRRTINVKYVEKAEKREWTRRTEAWTVRKFPRTYHRGTDKEFTIWIEPHKRGIGKVTPKEYRV